MSTDMITPYLVDPLQLQLNHSNLTVAMSGIISRLINFFYLTARRRSRTCKPATA